MTVVLLATWVSIPAVGWAGAWTSLTVFGDSLSDAGNATGLTRGFFPPSPPYAGRFSNGPVAAEYLAELLGVPLVPSAAGGTAHAVGGATTGVLNYNFEVDSPRGLRLFPTLATTGVLAQVAAVLGHEPTFDPATSLFMVWGGPNDIFLAVEQGITDAAQLALVVQDAVENVAAAVALLGQAGAQHVLVPSMADLGRAPGFLGTPEAGALTALTTAFNAGLALAMARVEAELGIDVILFDTFAALDHIMSAPAEFGFTSTTTACLSAPADLLRGCPGYLFFDGVHPTTAGHRALGDLLVRAVLPTLAAAVLPGSRSVQVGQVATAFATILNTGPAPGLACRIAPPPGFPATFAFQTTDPTTNQPSGQPDVAVDIPADEARTFVLSFTPLEPIALTEVAVTFDCVNSLPASVIPGVNTLLLTASATPVPDVVALAMTIDGTGAVSVPIRSTGPFAVATANLGAGAAITVSADTGPVALPVTIDLCQTDPATGACLGGLAPELTVSIATGDTPTFGVFVTAAGPVPLALDANRIFVRFTDGAGVVRGSTSVAVEAE